jgi:hypothetical protein
MVALIVLVSMSCFSFVVVEIIIQILVYGVLVKIVAVENVIVDVGNVGVVDVDVVGAEAIDDCVERGARIVGVDRD